MNHYSIFHAFVGKCTVLSVVACIVAVNVNLFIPNAGAQGTEPCPDPCVCGWVDSSQFHGGIECSHGPEEDNDCGYPQQPLTTFDEVIQFIAYTFRCCEQRDQVEPEKLVWMSEGIYLEVKNHQIHIYRKNPDGSRDYIAGFPETIPDCDATTTCHCYECGTGCEAQFQYWFNHCGVSDSAATGNCDFEELAPEDKNVAIKRSRPVNDPPMGAACNGGTGHHPATKFYCGAPDDSWQRDDYADCIGNNCGLISGAPWEDAGQPGNRYRCPGDDCGMAP